MWYRYETRHWWRHTRGMTDEEKGRFADQFHEALEDGRVGANPIADLMLAEAATFSDKRRKAGLASGEARRMRAIEAKTPRTSVEQIEQVFPLVEQNRTINRPTDQTDERTRQIPRPPMPPTPRTTGASGAAGPSDRLKNRDGGSEGAKDGGLERLAGEFDRKFRDEGHGFVFAMPASALPYFAAWYCGEIGNKRATGRYFAFCQEKGADAFRELVDSFVAECAAGEEPESRARAFSARVSKAMRAKPGRDCRESVP